MKSQQLGEKGDLSATPGSELWAIAVKGQLSLLMSKADSSVRNIQLYLKKMEETKAYKQLRNIKGYQFSNLYEFCLTPKPFGLGEELSVILSLLLETKDIVLGQKRAELAAENQADAAKRQYKQRGGDRRSGDFKQYNKKNDILFEKKSSKSGTSREASLRRLELSRPDLHEKCLAGDMTAHAAMIEAGFRKKRQHRKKSILTKLEALWQQADTTERQRIVDWINRQAEDQGCPTDLKDK